MLTSPIMAIYKIELILQGAELCVWTEKYLS